MFRNVFYSFLQFSLLLFLIGRNSFTFCVNKNKSCVFCLMQIFCYNYNIFLIITLCIFWFDTFPIPRRYPRRGTRVILSAMSLRALVPSRSPVRVPDTLARALHSGNACMNECPSVPHDSEQEEEEKTGGPREGSRGEGSRAARSFSTAAGTRRAPFGPYVPICGPFPRAVRFDVVFFKAVFTKRGPLSRLFFVPKNG